MRLLHYTNAQNARGIVADREITDGITKALKTGIPRSVVDPQWDDVIDGVIWLTTDRAARQAWQGVDFKHQFRFEVEVPDPITWADYAASSNLPDWYRDMLAYPGTKPDTWYVTTDPIPAEMWHKLTLTEGEKRIWRAGQQIEPVVPIIEAVYEYEQAQLRAMFEAAHS